MSDIMRHNGLTVPPKHTLAINAQSSPPVSATAPRGDGGNLYSAIKAAWWIFLVGGWPARAEEDDVFQAGAVGEREPEAQAEGHRAELRGRQGAVYLGVLCTWSTPLCVCVCVCRRACLCPGGGSCVCGGGRAGVGCAICRAAAAFVRSRCPPSTTLTHGRLTRPTPIPDPRRPPSFIKHACRPLLDCSRVSAILGAARV